MTDEERNEQNDERDDEERSEEDDESKDSEASGEDQTSGQDDDDSGDESSASSGDDDSGEESSSSSDDDEDDDSGDGGGSSTSVSDVMSKDPQSVEPGDSIEDAAKKMKEGDTGALLVVDGDELKGIVTDRDIVVNAIAEGNTDASVEDVASTDTTTIEPDASLGDAIQLMRDNKVRRLPVVENDEPVGIVSLGDLAIEADDDSALKEISAAEQNA
jgi:CBS domain-containing protein